MTPNPHIGLWQLRVRPVRWALGRLTQPNWRILMATPKDKAGSEKPYDVIYLAKKHRISNEDAKKIIDAHGADRKAADKAARRISV